MANITDRLNVLQQHKERAQQKTSAPAQPAQPTQPAQQPKSDLAVQIMGQLWEDQAMQAQKQNANRKAIMIANQEPLTPSKMLKQQHDINAANEDMLRQQYLMQQTQIALQNVMPKEQVQDSANVSYIDPNTLATLEKIYMSLPPKKRIRLDQLLPYTTSFIPMKDYQGFFVDVNADKQQRPLGIRTNFVEEV